MVENSPNDVQKVQRLRDWAVSGPGRALFNWGTAGDFARCEAFYKGKMPERMIPGWCATLHKLATGATPGHAPGEEVARKTTGH